MSSVELMISFLSGSCWLLGINLNILVYFSFERNRAWTPRKRAPMEPKAIATGKHRYFSPVSRLVSFRGSAFVLGTWFLKPDRQNRFAASRFEAP
jgi:hypothetical protein